MNRRQKARKHIRRVKHAEKQDYTLTSALIASKGALVQRGEQEGMAAFEAQMEKRGYVPNGRNGWRPVSKSARAKTIPGQTQARKRIP